MPAAGPAGPAGRLADPHLAPRRPARAGARWSARSWLRLRRALVQDRLLRRVVLGYGPGHRPDQFLHGGLARLEGGHPPAEPHNLHVVGDLEHGRHLVADEHHAESAVAD